MKILVSLLTAVLTYVTVPLTVVIMIGCANFDPTRCVLARLAWRYGLG